MVENHDQSLDRFWYLLLRKPPSGGRKGFPGTATGRRVGGIARAQHSKRNLMPSLRKIELDVLKPHLPNVLELADAIAALGPSYQVDLDVVEMDEKTETLTLVIAGEDLDYVRIEDAIRAMGGSIHSIDKCTVTGDSSNEV